MTTVPFDTLELARKLEAAGFPQHQAQDTAAALATVMGEELVTRSYLDSRLERLELRLLVRLGGMLVAGVIAVGVLASLF